MATMTTKSNLFPLHSVCATLAEVLQACRPTSISSSRRDMTRHVFVL